MINYAFDDRDTDCIVVEEAAPKSQKGREIDDSIMNNTARRQFYTGIQPCVYRRSILESKWMQCVVWK